MVFGSPRKRVKYSDMSRRVGNLMPDSFLGLASMVKLAGTDSFETALAHDQYHGRRRRPLQVYFLLTAIDSLLEVTCT